MKEDDDIGVKVDFEKNSFSMASSRGNAHKNAREHLKVLLKVIRSIKNDGRQERTKTCPPRNSNRPG